MSFFTSLSGLKNAQTELGAIAHNIANVETTGFKKSSASFADLVSNGNSGSPKQTRGIGSVIAEIKQDFGLGAIEQTGNSTDLSINGNGFFVTRGGDSGGEMFTRDGAFALDEDGYLQDGFDNRLQMFEVDAAGVPTSPGTTVDVLVPPVNGAGAELSGVTIRNDGLITAAYADGANENIGRVALASFTSPTGLRQLGSSSWEATAFSGPAALNLPGVGSYGDLLAGTLERSNVDLAEEMVGLISAQRNFQANAKAIDTASQITQTIINLRT